MTSNQEFSATLPNDAAPAPATLPAPSTEKTLRHLFLTLFLRGHSSRGLQKKTVPKSVAQKLAFILIIYACFGCLAFNFRSQPVFALAIYLHAITFVMVAMFVASSAGEILFNNQEADILLHRPVEPRALLTAKVRVLVEVSLWLAAALNLAGLFVGLNSPDGGLRFPLAHAFSTILEALFCTGSVVLAYQICLRRFGRERLEAVMTTSQVIVSIGAVLAGQLLPQLTFRMGGIIRFSAESWWLALLPPAWFAALDDVLAGSAPGSSWLLAALAVVVTALVLWLALGKLAQDYATGLQTLGETVSPRRSARRRRIEWLIDRPPLSWWLRDPVPRASFLLTTAYLFRDRETKLRIYPGLAPILVVPFIFLMQGFGHRGAGAGGFGTSFAGAYAGLIPMLALSMLQYSTQWPAAEIFRAAPIAGPAPLCRGARQAILLVVTIPLLLVFALIIWLIHSDASQLLLVLPGLILLPIYALIPNLGGKGVPLSLPSDEAKSTARGLYMVAAVFISMALSGIASWALSAGWFWHFTLVESLIAAAIYLALRHSISKAHWPTSE